MNNRKLIAILVITTLLLGTFSLFAPAYAHFTLGDPLPNTPYRENDGTGEDGAPDADHLPGVLAYVWAGGGLGSFTDADGDVTGDFDSPPGYVPPFGAAGDLPFLSWAQLDGTAYAPFGAILTSTEDHDNVGDLIFGLTCYQDALDTPGDCIAPTDPEVPSYVFILVPPEFGGIDREQIVTTLTNYVDYIRVNVLPMDDPIAPGWTRIRVRADSDLPFQWDIVNNVPVQWYYIRVNGVIAPTIAGRYFFKVALSEDSRLDADDGFNDFDGFGVLRANWPVLLVKGEIDPAIIFGELYFGGFNTQLYGERINLPGLVRAVGIADDPYTGESTGREVEARGYFNNESLGHFEIEGVAPGVYDIFAQAAGYPEQQIASDVKLLKGQSYHFDGYINPGPVWGGEIFSKHGFGEEEWPFNDDEIPVVVELYNDQAAAADATPTSEPPDWDTRVAVSPTGLQQGYFNSPIFDDYERAYKHYNQYRPGAGAFDTLFGFAWLGAGTVPGYNLGGDIPNGPYDPSGVGPEQPWCVGDFDPDPAVMGSCEVGQNPNYPALGATATSFRFQFGDKGLYGAPTVWDGHVPQVWATWIDGIDPGRYFVRVWVWRYVQTELDGITLAEYWFDVAPNEWAGDHFLPIDIRITSWVDKTLYFHDTAGTLEPKNVYDIKYDELEGALAEDILAGGIYVDLEDADGNLVAETLYYPTQEELEAGTTCSIPLTGFLSSWYFWDHNAGNNYYIPDSPDYGGECGDWQSQAHYGKGYGIPSGTYTVKVFVEGFVQQEFESVSLVLSGSPAHISNHVYLGVIFEITYYSIDWERPRVDRPWIWQDEPIRTWIYDEEGGDIDYFTGPEQDSSVTTTGPWYYWGDYWASGAVVSFETGQYCFKAFTYGYVQKKDFCVFAQKGSKADIKLNLMIGVNITVDIPFKKENIFTHLPFDETFRVRVFDQDGNLVAHATTSHHYDDHLEADDTTIQFYWENEPYVDAPLQLYHPNNYARDDVQGVPGTDVPGALFLPSSTTRLHLVLAGIYDRYDPVFGTQTYRYGIDGFPNYEGEWTVEVDFVNIYGNYEDVCTGSNPGGFGPQQFTVCHYRIWYPPVQGLLMGESFHYIPGHPEGSFGYTGDVLAANHLGPWQQRGVWTVPNAHLGGEASVIYELDLRGYIEGAVYGFTWSDEFRTLSFVWVEAVGADGIAYVTYSWDGMYQHYLPPGTYTMNVYEWAPTSAGHDAVTGYSVAVSTGSTTTGLNFFLDRSDIPIPEFGTLLLAVVSALAASVFVLRRRRR